MEILKYPHPNLFIKCKEITVFGNELKVLLEAMWDTMVLKNGMGLASNQVGLDYRMFTMKGPEEEKLFIVNPKVLVSGPFPANLKEGCLSAPGEFLVLNERSNFIQILYQDETGTPRTGTFNGIHSVCVQHEMDHLDGKSHLQSKSIPKAQRKALAKKWGIK
jgi:peptide deformylase